jgi:hypothetical protein
VARPTLLDITAALEAWDAEVNTNNAILRDAPFPIHEHVGDESDLQSTFAAAAYDRCLVWVDHTVLGWTLYVSDGTNWVVADSRERAYLNLTATTTQTIGDQFVHFTGTGTVDYDLLAVASWAGGTVTLRNDKSSGTMNIDPNGSEVINALGAGAPLVLAAGSTATLYNNGTQVYASVAL